MLMCSWDASAFPAGCGLWVFKAFSKAQSGTAVLFECFVRPGSCCDLVQPLYLGIFMVVDEEKRKRLESEKG